MSMPMQSQKLYFNNPYQMEFTANVVHTVENDGRIGLILDRTAFYPTGGGQPHDLGSLHDYNVVEVIEDNNTIIHWIEGEYRGERQVAGKVDWQRRFDHMQQHAGQHILSAVIKKEYGWDTVGFHLGADHVTIDVTTSDVIPVVPIEQKVNSLILRKILIEPQFYARQALDAEVIRKVPGDEEYIRIVEIPGVDFNACCGTHPAYTSEIGLIKILHTEVIRGNRRIYFIAGWRALTKFQEEHQLLGTIATMLKSNTTDIDKRVSQLKADVDQQAKEIRRLSQEMIYWESLAWKQKYRPIGDYRLYIHAWQNRAFQELKELAKSLIEDHNAIVIFATHEPKAQVVLACSQNVHLSMLELAKELGIQISGKGGGSRVFAQVGGESESLESALEKLIVSISQLNETDGLGYSSVEKEV